MEIIKSLIGLLYLVTHRRRRISVLGGGWCDRDWKFFIHLGR